MATEVKIPAVGESITTANVANWFVKTGDQVAKGDALVTLETDKISNELTAEVSGEITILVAEGEEVDIGTVIATIDESAASSGATKTDDAPSKDDALPEAPSSVTAADSGNGNGSAPESGGQLIAIQVPPVGESITSASVATWYKQQGEQVAKGDKLVSLETDKISNELEAEADGTLNILIPEGEDVEIGTIIGEITVGTAPAKSPMPTPDPAPEKKEEATAPAPAEKAQPAAPTRKFSVVQNTEPLQKETEIVAQESSEGRTTRRKMSMLRRKIAAHLTSAQRNAAILSTFNEADMSAVMTLRKSVQEQFIEKHKVKLGFMSFFVKAVVQALKDVPQVNGSIDGQDIIENHYYDIGVAIGTEKGLVVPVIRDCDKKTFAEIEQDILDYATKAREGGLQLSDLQGGVFTISNGGTYGSLLSTPILNPPQSGILGMHTIQQRPVAVDGRVEIRPMMYLALSYDHRLVDGKDAVTFLVRVKDCIENPAKLMFGV